MLGNGEAPYPNIKKHYLTTYLYVYAKVIKLPR